MTLTNYGIYSACVPWSCACAQVAVACDCHALVLDKLDQFGLGQVRLHFNLKHHLDWVTSLKQWAALKAEFTSNYCEGCILGSSSPDLKTEITNTPPREFQTWTTAGLIVALSHTSWIILLLVLESPMFLTSPSLWAFSIPCHIHTRY